jgi:hypothetical protein
MSGDQLVKEHPQSYDDEIMRQHLNAKHIFPDENEFWVCFALLTRVIKPYTCTLLIYKYSIHPVTIVHCFV